MKAILITILSLSSFMLYGAESLDGYKSRFRLIRDEEGTAIRIIDRSLNIRLTFLKFSKTYNSWFINESSDLLNGVRYLSPDSEIESRTLNREIQNVLEEVRKYNLQKLIQSNGFDKVNDFLVEEFKKVSTIGFRTVSNLENTTFFYQNKQYLKVQESAKKEVQKYFPNELDEKVVSYLVERYIGFLKDSRTYHQSILLHYLSNFAPADLGMSIDEVGMSISSILEGDIKWHNILSRRRLKKNWTGYGLKKLKEIQTESLERVIKHRDLYNRTPFFANPYFAQTQSKNGEDIWINAFFQNEALDNSPSLSFDYTRPDFVYKKRRYFELLLFAGIQGKGPNRIKKYFTHLKYRRQMLKEGLLFGFYESRGNSKMMKQMIRQSLNPLETIFKIPL